MKDIIQLLINDEPSQFFFNKRTLNTEIIKWIEDNLEKFNLNEWFSCDVSMCLWDTIVISGDEDRVEIKIANIEGIVVTS